MKSFLRFRKLNVLFFVVIIHLSAGCVTEEPSMDKSKGAPYGEILIKGAGLNEKNLASSACDDFKLTEADVRKMFQTYHKVTRKEIQTKYQWSPCYTEGLIETPKAVFSWKARAGNTLETNYPTGKDVLLGGTSTR